MADAASILADAGSVGHDGYSLNDLYHPGYERTLLWNDPQVGIDWPFDGVPLLSGKDERGQSLSVTECYESVTC